MKPFVAERSETLVDKNDSKRLSSADLKVLKKLLLFSVAMFAFPISTFFILQSILPKGSVVLPASASVFTVHIVIGFYVWMALKEDSGAEEKGGSLKED